MPNPGGPYTGCDTCRRRKVKCDQTYPYCRRCAKRGDVCPGVKERRMEVFRDQTRKVIARVEMRQSQRNTSNTLKQTAGSLAPCESSATFDIGHTHVAEDETRESLPIARCKNNESTESLSTQLPPPLEAILVAFFFDQIASPDFGWWAYLPGLYRNAASSSYLHDSIRAASLFVLANQRQDPSSLLAHGRKCYGSALNALNRAISDEHERLKDEILCTVLILNATEDITGCADRTSQAHISGLEQLLRIRKNLGVKSLFGAEIWNSVAMKSQVLTLRITDEPLYLNQMLIPQMLVTPALLTQGTYKAVRGFRIKAEEFISDPTLLSNEEHALHCLLQEAGQSDLELLAWSEADPGTILTDRWQRHFTTEILGPGMEVRLEYFSSIEAAQAWNQLRCARIHLHQAVVNLVEHALRRDSLRLDSHTLEIIRTTISESQSTIQEMLDGICASIPYNLHRINSAGELCDVESQRVIGGTGLIWPLEVILSSPHSSVTHKALAKDTLGEIGHLIGVKQALVVLDEFKS